MPASTDYKALYEQSLALNANLQLKILQLSQQLTQLQKIIFGSRHERFVPEDSTHPQLSLDLVAEPTTSALINATQQISYTRNTVSVVSKPLEHPGRMKLPESLRLEEILIEPSADTTRCKKIGEEITEVLEYQPGELYVKQYKRSKYARPENGGILIGQLPSRPLEKSIAGAGLLAQVIIDKYIDHLPLHRQMQHFERTGVKLAYSTLSDWVHDTCNAFIRGIESRGAEK